MTAPGWYPDPLGGQGARYWNGQEWDGIAPESAREWPEQDAAPPVAKGKRGRYVIGVVALAVLIVLAITVAGNRNNGTFLERSTVAATPSWNNPPATMPSDDMPADFKKADILRDVLVAQGIHIGTVGEVGAAAQTICVSIRRGEPEAYMVNGLQELWPQLSQSDAEFVIGASVEAFCP